MSPTLLRQRIQTLVTLAATLWLCIACGSDEPDYEEPSRILLGETREIELRYTRFDVVDFEQTLTKKELSKLPREIQDRLWLLDLDLTGGSASPRLLDNSLEQIRQMPASELSRAARNMQGLLQMTPANANLNGTSFEPLITLAPVLGVSTQSVLAEMLQINIEDTFLSTSIVAQTILNNVISTHPNAMSRRGPVTPNNPEGIYSVRAGSLPVTLADAASDFGTLSRRFGEVYDDGVYHPGFIVGDVKGKVFEDNFEMTVRTNANALPYKGVELRNVSSASVNSVASQIQHLFDFSDPNWLRIQGLPQGDLVIDEMTFRIVEADEFIPGGVSPAPVPYGNSPVWQFPAWTLERILVDASIDSFHDLHSHIRYELPNSDDAAMEMTVDNGWASIETAGGLGTPPMPQYIWDLLLEVGQTRLHDGDIPEGEANVEFTLKNLAIGFNSQEIEAQIRQNIEADPAALLDIATGLLDSTQGEADFYYYRPVSADQSDLKGDYLYFVAPEDIGLDDDGKPAREYSYDRVGFFQDPELTDLISSTMEIDGDTSHQKLKIEEGMRFYTQNTYNDVFQIVVLPKKSERIVELSITRVK